MTVRLLFFATLRERMHCRDAVLRLPEGATVSDLWQALCAQHAQLREVRAAVSFAVNQEYVDADHVLADDDEVALIPPVSGG
jgi:molybdopterin converting factor subunit 1